MLTGTLIGVAVMVTEAITEILVESVLFERLRAILEGNPENPRLLGILSRCGYCMSVWVGMGMAWVVVPALPVPEGIPVALWTILLGFALHRMSNLWHKAVRWMTTPFLGL